MCRPALKAEHRPPELALLLFVAITIFLQPASNTQQQVCVVDGAFTSV